MELNANDISAAPGDLIASMVKKEKEDWSFGDGKAQFLTGEL